ncbi:MAG: Bug family tripartite tricarboxylate transporter substrate binding protein [Burkholderiales bacterium]
MPVTFRDACVTIGVLLLLSAAGTSTQGYPTKAVRLVTDGSAGGGGDVLARIVVAELAKVLNQQVIVENRPGAGGTLAPPVIHRAPADGYTLLQVTVAAAANVTLRPNLPYDLLNDFSPVSQVASGPAVVVVHPSLPVRSIKELIALARARPGEVNYSSAGTGSSTFLGAELFKHAAGVNLVHVAYRGGAPALVGVVSGETAVMFSPLGSSLPLLNRGALRALAVTTSGRVPAIANVPTVAEAGVPNYEFSNWYGWFARAGTPEESINTIQRALVSVLGQPNVAQRLSDLGYLPVGSKREEFAAYVKENVDRLRAVLQSTKTTGR